MKTSLFNQELKILVLNQGAMGNASCSRSEEETHYGKSSYGLIYPSVLLQEMADHNASTEKSHE